MYRALASPAGDQLTVFDKQGNVLQTFGEPGRDRFVTFSPDGSHVAATRYDQSTNPESVTNAVKVHNLKANFARMHTLIV